MVAVTSARMDEVPAQAFASATATYVHQVRRRGVGISGVGVCCGCGVINPVKVGGHRTRRLPRGLDDAGYLIARGGRGCGRRLAGGFTEGIGLNPIQPHRTAALHAPERIACNDRTLDAAYGLQTCTMETLVRQSCESSVTSCSTNGLPEQSDLHLRSWL